MKKVIFALFVLGLVSCGPSAEEKAAMDVQAIKDGKMVVGSNSKDYKVVKIGDCEYISGWGGSTYGGPVLTHKGDCSNPIHDAK